ncbi:Pentatricopeptide repeat-containing protein, chloroplastic [Glycine soja]
MCCNVEQTWGRVRLVRMHGPKFSTIIVTALSKTSCIQFTVVQSKFGCKGCSPMEKKGRRQQERNSTACGKVKILLSLAKRHLLLLGMYVCLPIAILFIQNLRFGVYKLPNEKEVVYGALDKRTTWETEFLVIAVSKALQILKKKVIGFVEKLSTSAFLPVCGDLLQAQG